MKNLFKSTICIILSIVMIASLALVFSSCGKKDNNNDDETSPLENSLNAFIGEPITQLKAEDEATIKLLLDASKIKATHLDESGKTIETLDFPIEDLILNFALRTNSEGDFGVDLGLKESAKDLCNANVVYSSKDGVITLLCKELLGDKAIGGDLKAIFDLLFKSIGGSAIEEDGEGEVSIPENPSNTGESTLGIIVEKLLPKLSKIKDEVLTEENSDYVLDKIEDYLDKAKIESLNFSEETKDIEIDGTSVSKVKVSTIKINNTSLVNFIKSLENSFKNDAKFEELFNKCLSILNENEEEKIDLTYSELFKSFDEELLPELNNDINETGFVIELASYEKDSYLLKAEAKIEIAGGESLLDQKTNISVYVSFGADPKNTRKIEIGANVPGIGDLKALLENKEEGSKTESTASLVVNTLGVEVKNEIFKFTYDKETKKFEINADFAFLKNIVGDKVDLPDRIKCDGTYETSANVDKIVINGVEVTITENSGGLLDSFKPITTTARIDLGLEISISNKCDKIEVPEYTDITKLSEDELFNLLMGVAAKFEEVFGEKFEGLFGVAEDYEPAYEDYGLDFDFEG